MRNEKELIRKILKGEKELFSLFIREYENQIYSLCVSIVKKREEAVDLVQDTFYLAFKNLSSFKGNSKFSTWLYRIAYNLSISRVRRKNNFLSLDGVYEDGKELDIEDETSDIWFSIDEEEIKMMIEEGMKKLKPWERAIIELRDIKNLNYDEIAEVLGIPMGTVKSRLNRARNHLRKIIEREFGTKGNKINHIDRDEDKKEL